MHFGLKRFLAGFRDVVLTVVVLTVALQELGLLNATFNRGSVFLAINTRAIEVLII